MPGFHLFLTKAAAVSAVMTGLLVTVSASAQDRYLQRGCPTCRDYQYGQPDLFRNYYLPPTCGGVGATMYVAPGPVPPLVGHTYVTYEPFMPHEYLYAHHNTYHRYYNDGRGLTRTHVSWYSPPGTQVKSHLHHAIKLAR